MEAWFSSGPAAGDQGARTEQLDHWNGTTPVYVDASTITYDALGRATVQTDTYGHKTRTDYTPTLGGPVTAVKVTNALGQSTTKSFNAALGLPMRVTDPNGEVTDTTYDGAGRLLSVWAPGRSKTAYPKDPSLSYAYNLRKNAPSTVVAKSLTPYGSATYRTIVSLYDGMLRLRQTQTQTLTGGRAIADTVYNSRGLVDSTSSPYYDIDNAAPATALVVAVNRPEVPAITANVYDGAGRPTDAIALNNLANIEFATGEFQAFTVEVASATEPLKVTLAWSDAPGSSGAADPVVNNLDLTVAV